MSAGDVYCMKHGWDPCACAGVKPRIKKPSEASLPKALAIPPSPLLTSDDDEEVTPARRPASIARIQLWGLAELWLAENDARGLVLRVAEAGMVITAIDPLRGERNEVVKRDEDPSRAAMRAISRMVEE